jgi:hypothetical protein
LWAAGLEECKPDESWEVCRGLGLKEEVFTWLC